MRRGRAYELLNIHIRVEPCGNTREETERVFQALEEPRPARRLRPRESGGGPAEDWWVTGWEAAREIPCPARVCKVADSGDGTALLVFGGTGGVRVQRSPEPPAAFHPDDRRQEGEPFLLLASDAVEILE